MDVKSSPSPNSKPYIPPKLPKEFRKKLSISYFEESSQNLVKSEVKIEQEEYGNYDLGYVQPIQQPSFSKTDDLSDEECMLIYPSNAFPNDSVYLEFTSETCNKIELESSDDSNNDDQRYLNLDEMNSQLLNDRDKSITNQTNSESDYIVYEEQEKLSEQVQGLIIHEVEINQTTETVQINKDLVSYKAAPTADSEPQPPIPPKRKKCPSSFQSSYSINSSITTSSSVSRLSDNSDIYNSSSYIQPYDSKKYTLASFKKELFKKAENRICADCKMHNSSVTYISCKYFITLCSSCAEYHKRLPRRNNKFDIIEIDILFTELQRNSIINNDIINADQLLYIFNEAGNERMNSLLEFEIEKIRSTDFSSSNEKFIYEKYINKQFINQTDLDLSKNYQFDSNRNLYNIVGSPTIAMTIYYLYLGANINYFENQKTVLDMALDKNQKHQYCYLKINNAPSYNQLCNFKNVNYEFEGDLMQIFEFNSKVKSSFVKVNIKLHEKYMLLTQTDLRYRQMQTKIDYSSVIKIFTIQKKNAIEIKWCNKSNNSLISTYFQYSDINEKKIWMREFLIKILKNHLELCDDSKNAEILNLINMTDECVVNAFGFLDLMNSFYFLNTSDDCSNEGEKILTLLLETLDSQKNHFFKRNLLLIRNSNAQAHIFDCLDLRKVAQIKKQNDLLIVDMPSKSYTLKSNGYTQNLSSWYDQIQNLSKMNTTNSSIEEQYLSKENIPLIIEKSCSFIELNFIGEKDFYSSLNSSQNSLTSLLDFKIIDKKIELLYNKIDKDKDFIFDAKKMKTSLILNLFKIYFMRYFKTETNLGLFLQYDQEELETVEKLKTVMDKHSILNPSFYYTMLRICTHLNIILNFNHKNQINKNYLINLFLQLILNSNHEFSQSSIDLRSILDLLVTDCAYIFELKENYLKIQYDMAEKSIYLKENFKDKTPLVKHLSVPAAKYSINVYLYHKHSTQSFQANVDNDYTCADALVKAKDVFKLVESKYWSLFEVIHQDHDKLNSSFHESASNNSINESAISQKQGSSIYLERILPIDAKLMQSSNWNHFYYVIKLNYVQLEIEKSFLCSNINLNRLSFSDSCDSMIYCCNCGCYKLSQTDWLLSHSSSSSCSSYFKCNNLSHKRWNKSSLSVQNANIQLIKIDPCKDYDDLPKLDQDFLKDKILLEAKIEDCIIYLGLYETEANELDESFNKSIIFKRNSTVSDGSDPPISEKRCISIYHTKTNLLYCIHLENIQLALMRYYMLFKLGYNSKSWSYFESDQLPKVKPKVPEKRYTTDSSS